MSEITMSVVWHSSTPAGSSIPTETSMGNHDESGEPGSKQSFPCGYCDKDCIYYLIETFFTLGIIANAVVVFRVFMDKELRNTTFVSIAACAFADMCFLAINLVLSFEYVILAFTCGFPGKVYGFPQLAIKSVAWFSANGHVALLAVLRYIFLTFPLKANAYITISRICMMSGLVWAIAIVVIVAMSLVITFSSLPIVNTHEFQLLFWITIYLMPLVTTVTLHVVKVYKVKKMTSETATENTRRLLRGMSRMVIAVVILATALPFPYVVYRVLATLDENLYASAEMAYHFSRISNLFVFLNHSINPIIYAFLSKPFRMSLKRMVGYEESISRQTTMTSSQPERQRRSDILKRMTE